MESGKHQNEWIATLKTYAFPSVGDRLVSDGHGPLVRGVLPPIRLAKPGTACGFGTASERCLTGRTHMFPCDRVPVGSLSKSFPGQPKNNQFAALPYSGSTGFLEKLGEREFARRAALEAFTLLAARSGEIRDATWSELDLEDDLWTVPAARMKTVRPHIVSPPPEAIAVFKRAQKFKAGAGEQSDCGERHWHILF